MLVVEGHRFRQEINMLADGSPARFLRILSYGLANLTSGLRLTRSLRSVEREKATVRWLGSLHYVSYCFCLIGRVFSFPRPSHMFDFRRAPRSSSERQIDLGQQVGQSVDRGDAEGVLLAKDAA